MINHPDFMMKNLRSFFLVFFLILSSSTLLTACSTTTEVNKALQQANTPENWTHKQFIAPVEDNWLAQLAYPQIQTLVTLALNNNFQLKQAAYAVEIKKQQLRVSASDLWPSLDLTLSNQRRKTASPDNDSNNNATYATNASIDLALQYELDLWGKLSAAERQANLTLLAQQASFEQAKQQLVVDVVIAWFSVKEADQLLTLYQQRAANTAQNLSIITSGYQQGLNSALDVYLARNEMNNEKSRTSEQQTLKIQKIRQLEQLLGQYPEGDLLIKPNENDKQLPLLAPLLAPLLDNAIPLGLPTELVSRKPALLASWYQLLAKDAALAYAHKQRFPRLSLTASVGDNQNDLSELLSASSLAWSLLGNLTAPIFNAGRLKANEAVSRLELQQTEQGYLSTLHDAFADVENAITREASLKERYQTMLMAQNNAIAAQNLSFEQYQNGLVSYTTVLDAQSRSFDAQSTVIQIKHQLITNRIQLHLALGGDFSSTTPDTSVNE